MQNIQVSAFTAQMKSEFWKGWQETAPEAQVDAFMTRLSSTTKIENYPNFSPSPAMMEWDGMNNYGGVGSYVYSLDNRLYRASLEFSALDLDDDQTGALAEKPKELATKAKDLISREVMKCLGSGTTGTFAADGTYYGPTFDGLNFFANRTAGVGFGIGNNLLPNYQTAAYAGGTGDTTAYQICALYHGPQCKTLRPLIWQHRDGPKFNTNMGDVQADESLQVRCWATMRGRAGYGIWYNAVRQPILGKPNVAEVQDIFTNIESAFRTFQLPKSRSTTFGEYVFEQTTFNASNLTMCGSTALAVVLRKALTEDWAAQNIGQYNAGATPTTSNNTVAATNNTFKGYAGYLVSNFLN